MRTLNTQELKQANGGVKTNYFGAEQALVEAILSLF